MAKKNTIPQILPTEAQIIEFEMLQKLLNSTFTEMKEFSKKKPDDKINKFKIFNINKILIPIKKLLANEPTVAFLELLDEDSVPSYSDAVLIIAQYISSMNQFHSIYHGWDGMNHRWFTTENPGKDSKWL